MSALALKGQKHRWYCICAICIWLNNLITMVDSWVNNIRAERTQLFQNTSLPWHSFYCIYTSKIALLQLYHTKKLRNTIKQLGTLKMSLQLLSNRPQQVLLSTARVHLMLGLLYWLHWFCRLIAMFFCCFFLFFILRFTWKQLITLKNKLKWWWH